MALLCVILFSIWASLGFDTVIITVIILAG